MLTESATKTSSELHRAMNSRRHSEIIVTVAVQVAYCGRVPVKVRGTYSFGDILVASGADDGCSIAISITSTRQNGSQRVDESLRLGRCYSDDNPQELGTRDANGAYVKLVECAVFGPNTSGMFYSSRASSRLRVLLATVSIMTGLSIFIAIVFFCFSPTATASTANSSQLVTKASATEPRKPSFAYNVRSGPN